MCELTAACALGILMQSCMMGQDGKERLGYRLSSKIIDKDLPLRPPPTEPEQNVPPTRVAVKPRRRNMEGTERYSVFPISHSINNPERVRTLLKSRQQLHPGPCNGTIYFAPSESRRRLLTTKIEKSAICVCAQPRLGEIHGIMVICSLP